MLSYCHKAGLLRFELNHGQTIRSRGQLLVHGSYFVPNDLTSPIVRDHVAFRFIAVFSNCISSQITSQKATTQISVGSLSVDLYCIHMAGHPWAMAPCLKTVGPPKHRDTAPSYNDCEIL